MGLKKNGSGMKYGFAEKKRLSGSTDLKKKNGSETKYRFAEKKMMGIHNVMKDYQEVCI